MPERLTIDKVFDGDTMLAEQVIILDDKRNIMSPDVAGELWTVGEYLQWLNEHPEMHQMTGWDVLNQLPDESEPLTRWDRMVIAMQKLADDTPLKVKGLRRHYGRTEQSAK